ncbi:unnamed protein product, partial [Adineta steineri]
SSTLSAQFPPQINAPIFPPNIQPLSNINNIRINSTSSPSPSPSNTHNTSINPISSPVNMLNTQINSTSILPNFSNANGSAISPANISNIKTNSMPSLPNVYNPNVNPTPPPIINSSSMHTSPAPSSSNVYNPHINPAPQLSSAFNNYVNPTPTPPLPNTFNTNPMNTFNTHGNPTPPLVPSGYNMNTSTNSPLQTTYNTNQNSTPPPLSHTYNSSSTNSTAFSQPPTRPMYPAPSSAYRPQPIPQTMNQNTHPLPPPPPTSASSSTYPYPQQNYTSNPPVAGYPGQPPVAPQPMHYSMGGSTAAAMTQPHNNLHGPPSNNDMVDLLKETDVVSPYAEEPPMSLLLSEENQQMNCNPEVMRCSLNVIPQTKDLLNKSRLPLGVLIHPFKDLESLSVIQGSKIVRCDSCKSYINPFVSFLDNTRWRCSICFRV